MGIIQTVEQWAFNVALKKVVAALIGFLASQQAISGLAWLQAHGVTLNVDLPKFQEAITLLGIGGFAAGHDWLKLKFPDSKWL